MRIDAINLNRQTHEYMGIGLPTLPMDEPLQLSDFGQCVVIAGKNGSGKTRLLTLLAEVAKKYVTPEMRRQIEFELTQQLEAKRIHEVEVQRIETQGLRQGENSGQLDQFRRNIAVNETEIERHRQTLAVLDAFTMSGEGLPKIVFFVPKSTELKGPADGRELEATNLAAAFASGLAAEGSHIGAPAYARLVMRAATNERGRRVQTAATDKHDTETKLIETLTSLLGEEVRFVLDDSQNLKLEGLRAVDAFFGIQVTPVRQVFP